MAGKVEFIKRNFPAEFRAVGEEQNWNVEGVPIVLETPTDIGNEFEEVIEKGAIDEKTLKDDVRFFWNHNIDEKALARSVIPIDKKGGLELEIKDNKVLMKANLNLERSDAKDLYLAIQDGTINAMSFMFGIEKDHWERLDTDYPKRVIEKISPVVEVSAVNWPAYKTTSIKSARADMSTEIDKRAMESARKQMLAETNKTKLDYKTRNLLKMYGGKK